MSFILAGCVLLLALFAGIILEGRGVKDGQSRRRVKGGVERPLDNRPHRLVGYCMDAAEAGDVGRQFDAGIFGVNI